MGQAEILRMMQSEPDKWFRSSDFTKAFGINIQSVNSSLRRMEKMLKKRRYFKNALEYRLKEEAVWDRQR